MTRKREKAQRGLETGPDGADIGRDPRRLEPDELRALGHRAAPLLQAMRRRCVDCCGGKTDEVRRCTAVACPLWPYRMGTDPWRRDAARDVATTERATETPPPAVAPRLAQQSPVQEPEVRATPAGPAPEPLAAKRRPDRKAAQAAPLPLFDDADAS